MASVSDIKTRLKTILAAVSGIDQVFTEDREEIEGVTYVVMMHTGFTAKPGPGTTESVTDAIQVSIILHDAAGDLPTMFARASTLMQSCRQAIRAYPTLDTGAGPLVFSCRVVAGAVNIIDTMDRVIVDLTVQAEHEEG